MDNNVPANGERVTIVAKETGKLDNLNRFLHIIGKQDDRAMVLALATFIEDRRATVSRNNRCIRVRILDRG